MRWSGNRQRGMTERRSFQPPRSGKELVCAAPSAATTTRGPLERSDVPRSRSVCRAPPRATYGATQSTTPNASPVRAPHTGRPASTPRPESRMAAARQRSVGLGSTGDGGRIYLWSGPLKPWRCACRTALGWVTASRYYEVRDYEVGSRWRPPVGRSASYAGFRTGIATAPSERVRPDPHVTNSEKHAAARRDISMFSYQDSVQRQGPRHHVRGTGAAIDLGRSRGPSSLSGSLSPRPPADATPWGTRAHACLSARSSRTASARATRARGE